MRNCYVLEDIDALFFMVENMLSVQVLLLQTLFSLCLFLVSISGITIIYGLCV